MCLFPDSCDSALAACLAACGSRHRHCRKKSCAITKEKWFLSQRYRTGTRMPCSSVVEIDRGTVAENHASSQERLLHFHGKGTRRLCTCSVSFGQKPFPCIVKTFLCITFISTPRMHCIVSRGISCHAYDSCVLLVSFKCIFSRLTGATKVTCPLQRFLSQVFFPSDVARVTSTCML